MTVEEGDQLRAPAGCWGPCWVLSPRCPSVYLYPRHDPTPRRETGKDAGLSASTALPSTPQELRGGRGSPQKTGGPAVEAGERDEGWATRADRRQLRAWGPGSSPAGARSPAQVVQSSSEPGVSSANDTICTRKHLLWGRIYARMGTGWAGRCPLNSFRHAICVGHSNTLM